MCSYIYIDTCQIGKQSVPSVVCSDPMKNIQPEQRYLCLLLSFSYRIGSTVSYCVSLSIKCVFSNIYFLTFFYLLSFMVQCQYLSLWLKRKAFTLKLCPFFSNFALSRFLLSSLCCFCGLSLPSFSEKLALGH